MTTYKVTWSLLLNFSLLLFLTACSGDGTSPTSLAVDPSPTTQVTKIPADTTQLEEIASPISPIATPTAAEATAQPPKLPTPAPGTGVIYGRAGEPGEQGRIFSISSSIYLGQLHYTRNSEGTPILPLVGLDTDNDPNVELHVGEYFVFSNIPPGEYAFVLVSPVENYVVPGDHSSGFKIVSLAEGDVVDIGELPLP